MRVRATRRPWTGRELLAGLAAAWIAGGVLLFVAWHSGVESERMRDAPQCTRSQEFTPARCVIELDGTLTDATATYAQMDVAGRHVSMTINLREAPAAEPRPVRVTFYRGKPIHIEAAHLSVDTNDGPVDDRIVFTFGGLFLIVASSAAALGSYVTGRRPDAS